MDSTRLAFRLVRWIALAVLALQLLGCSTAASRPEKKTEAVVEVDGVIIRNQLGIPVTDVRILAVAAGDFVTCGNITARSTCSTGFSNRYYSSDKLQVTWKEYGAPQSTDEFDLEPADDIQLGRPAQVEVIIFSPGQAGVRLVQ